MSDPGLDCVVPDDSKRCRRQKTLMVELPYRGGSDPLHLLIDSIGIKAEGEREWNARKDGAPSGASGARCISGSMKKHWRTDHRARPKARKD